MEFIDCYAGEAGSIHDSCLFRRSNLFKKITDGTYIYSALKIFPFYFMYILKGTCVFNPNQHLLGDQGYALKPYLLIPFKDCGNLNNENKKYNNIHSSVRVVIERAFGLLKGRFRRLQKIQSRKVEFIPLLIMSACILHNFCLKNNDFFEETFIYLDDDVTTNDTRQSDSGAANKRDAIVRVLQ